MQFLSYYFGQHKIRNVLFYAGEDTSKEQLFEIFDLVRFENFYIISKNKELIDSLVKCEEHRDEYQIIKLTDLKSIFSSHKDLCVAINYAKNINEISFLLEYKPKDVIGYFHNNYPTYDLWEKLRDFAYHVSLAAQVNEIRNIVLEWNGHKDDIELSVVLPVYNVANYLEKCIKSISKWGAPFIEFLFVNDGSPDNSREIILEYAKKDPRIKLLDKENGGCASAREYGLSKANGRYVGFVDPDDFVEPTMFKELLKAALTGTYDISYSGYYEYYEETKTSAAIPDLTGWPYDIGTTDRKYIDMLIAYRRIAIWRGIYKKQFLTDANIHFHTDLRRFDDLPFKVETFALAKSVVSVDKPLYYYRMGRPGQDVSATDKRLFIHFDIFAHLDKFFEKHQTPDSLNYYRIVKLQTHYWALSILNSEFVTEYLKLAAKDVGIKNTKGQWKKAFKIVFKKEEIDNLFKKIKSDKARFVK